MVNKANIDLMIEAIENEPGQPIFMGDFVLKNNACGTTACLAGWANLIRLEERGSGAVIWPKTKPGMGDRLDNIEAAASWMGVNVEQANALFYTARVDSLPGDQSKKTAIQLLTKLRDEGDARWSEFVGLDSQGRPYLLNP